MLMLQLKNNLTKNRNTPHPFTKQWSIYESSLYLLVSYNQFFIINCGLNGYVYILKIALDILDKLIHDSKKYLWMFHTE